MEYTLSCPRCHSTKKWDRAWRSGPGPCPCGAVHPWKVLNNLTKRISRFNRDLESGPVEDLPSKKGFVIVMSDQGYQELHGPDYRENPIAWKKS